MPPIITRNHEYAKILSRTVKDNKGFTSLANRATLLDSAAVTQIVSGVSVNSMTIYDTYDSLPSSNLTKGNQAFVRATSHMYISDSNRWFSAAFINLTPTQTLDPSGNITLSKDGTSTIVTITATDSDQPESQLSYSIESDGNMLATGTTITQDSSVFTITPLTEAGGGIAGNFTLTFKTTDNINIASTTKDFSLAFSNIVDSSAPTVLLMKADGNSATNTAITYQNSSDASTGFTETGAPAASTFSPYRSGGYSTQFADGSGGNLNWSGTTLSGDYTIEAWIYTTEVDNSGYNNILSDLGSNVQFSLHNTTNGNMYTIYQSAVKLGPTASNTGLNEWVHFVWEREGTTLRHYCNGALLASATVDSNSFTISKIGQYYTGGYEHHGYIRDLRVMSSAKYGGNSYTVPTQPLAYTDEATTELLACHLPYIKAEGVTISRTGTTHTSTVGFGPYDYSPWTADDVGGSVYFDGTSDYMQVSNSSDFAFGTGDFTVEAWVNYTTFSGSGGQAIVSNGTSISSGTTGHWYLTAYGATDLRFGRHGSAQYTSVTSNLVVDAWNHIAVTRSGTTVRIFVNGVSLTTSDTAGGVGSYDFNNTSGILMIGEGASFSKASGHIADVRIIKGTAQYTSAFTPPTAPLSHTGSQTTLLMNNKSDANVYDAAAGNTFELINDTQSSTTQRKFTTSSSVYFDGSGDAIELPGKQDMLTFGTGDFTIECWFRPSVVNRNTAIMDFRPNSTTGSYPFIQPINTNLRMQNVSSGNLEATGVLAANTWIHIAVVRKNGTTTLYTDGVSRDTGADTTNYGCRSVPNIGKHNYSGSDLYGYLQDLRITKGYGRYTTNFTPPTTEFEL